jgi:Rrf2 family protein
LRLSTRGQYAVRAMLVLALYSEAEPIPLRQVAEIEEISEQYLEQIFVDLRRSKLVRGVRGARGGYQLTRPPSEITAGDIIRSVEGPIAPVECVTQNPAEACNRVHLCVTHDLWVRLAESMSAVLDNTTLKDLVDLAAEKQRIMKGD